MIKQMKISPPNELVKSIKDVWAFPNYYRLAEKLFEVGIPLIKKEFGIKYKLKSEISLVYSLSNFKDESCLFLVYQGMSLLEGFDKMRASLIYPGTEDSFGVEVVRARKKEKSSLEKYFKLVPIASGIFLYGKNPEEEVLFESVGNFVGRN